MFQQGLKQICATSFHNLNNNNRSVKLPSKTAALSTISVQRVKIWGDFDSLFQKASGLTYNHPTGQLNGRAGRRCILEDAERMLIRCLQIQPSNWSARWVMISNLKMQNRGRELDVSTIFLEGLQQELINGGPMERHEFLPVEFWKSLEVCLHYMDRFDKNIQKEIKDKLFTLFLKDQLEKQQ